MKQQFFDINKLKVIKYIVIDVDGTMTDGGIYYDEHGNEQKKFCTRDAAGFFAAKEARIITIVLTGRESAATARRMQELRVDYLMQNVKCKESFLQEFMKKKHISKDELAYVGDDINDFAAMKLAGYIACPKDACKEIIQISNFVSKKKGGEGVIRDTIEHILTKRGEWSIAINKAYGFGI